MKTRVIKPKNTVRRASGVMANNFVSLLPSLTVQQSLDKIREIGDDSSSFAYCFIVDNNNKLLGRISIGTLLLASPDALVGNIYTPDIAFIEPSTRSSQIVEIMRKEKLLAIPVVDNKENLKIVGAVMVEAVADIVEKEATREMHQGAGITSNASKSYFATSIWGHSVSRLPWLIFLLFASLLAGALVSYYEASFLQMPILVAFIPMIMGLAGAGGSQSSTVIIRSMAIGEIKTKQYFKAFVRELAISLVCGMAMGLVIFLYGLILYKDIILGFVLWLGLLATIIFAKSLGMILPVLAKKCKIDPALISSPLVTIIADIFGIFAYFTFATVLLGV